MTSLIDVWFLGYNSYYVMLRWSPDESFRRISSKIPLLYSMGPKIHQLKHSLLSCLSVLRHFPQGNHRSLITQHKVFRRNATDTASIDRLLSPLRESIIDKPPLASGTLQLPRLSSLSLLQNRQREPRCQLRRLHSAPYTWNTDLISRRYVDFANTSFGELEQLAQVCEPASFGINDKDVLDETYRKAR